MLVLAGDIGGTNARLALAETDGTTRIVADRIAPSRSIPDFTAHVADFLSASPWRPERACLAIAGPVVAETVAGTNLPWRVAAAELGDRLGIPALHLINDFEAVGHGIPLLGPRDILTLQEGDPDPAGAIGLIGAGTGLGIGMVVRSGGRRIAVPSEGGHATYAPRDPRGWALFEFLSRRYGGHVSWERVVSGPGLVDLFEFLAAGRETGAQIPLREEMQRDDPAAVITRHALAGTDRLAGEAMDLFVEAYGAQAGNLALTALATGGMYLAGGISTRIAGKLADGRFLSAFHDKGRMRDLLQRIPVRVILNPDVGLLGAASVAASQ
jgi:glucokinase